MLPRATAFCVVLVAACASTSRSVQQFSDIDLMDSARTPGLFMGHSTTGDLVVSATHYDAMVGLATTADELGLPMRKGSSGQMLCQRDGLAQVGFRQVCPVQDDPVHLCPVQIGVVQVGAAQIGADEGRSAQVDAAQRGAAQVGVAECGAAQIGLAQVGAAQIGLA